MISPGILIFFFFSFYFLGCLGVKGQKWPKIKNNYICYVPYLRNSIAYDCDFSDICLKWWYLLVFFSQFFKIWVFRVVRWVKWQKTVQNDKKFVICIPYLKNHMYHMVAIYGKHFQNDNVLKCFSNFWKF